MSKFWAAHDKLLALPRTGHRQTFKSLGFGYLYYAFVRFLRPQQIVCIGSLRGFVPIIMGLGCEDNGFGRVLFIDPGLVDSFWHSPRQEYFRDFGVSCVEHIPLRTEEYVETRDYQELGEVGLLYIDGDHSYEHVRFDYEAFGPKLGPDAFVLFHDAVETWQGEGLRHEVWKLLNELREVDKLVISLWPGLAVVGRDFSS